MQQRRIDLVLENATLGQAILADRCRRRADILADPARDAALMTVLLTGQPQAADNGVYEVRLNDAGDVERRRPGALSGEPTS